MRKARPHYPKMRDVAVMMRSLDVIPRDLPLRTGWRESLEHKTSNFRVAGQTSQIEWSVDIYAGQYYIVRVGSRLTEECTNVLSVVAYLCRMLGVKRVS